jgi:hypothetical protein
MVVCRCVGACSPAPDDPEIAGDIYFHVHVQMSDRYGSTYYDWVVYKSFRDFVALHTEVPHRICVTRGVGVYCVSHICL